MPRDEDAPPDDGDDDLAEDESQPWDPADDDDLCETGPASAWPALGAIPPGLAPRPSQLQDGRPTGGLLDVLLPWATLAGLGERPGTLGRIGAITAVQARALAQAAEHDPAAAWRVIVTSPTGQAIAVTRIRRPRRRGRDGPDVRRDGPGAARDGPPPGPGLVGRITVTIPGDAIAAACGPAGPAGRGRPIGPPSLTVAALRAAARALAAARERA